jgi:hypothetical protein
LSQRLSQQLLCYFSQVYVGHQLKCTMVLIAPIQYRFMVLFQIRERLLRRDEADPLKPRSTRSSQPNNTLTQALLESNTAMDGSLETGGMGIGDGEQKWWEH